MRQSWVFRSRWLLRGTAVLEQEPCLSAALRVPLCSCCPQGCGFGVGGCGRCVSSPCSPRPRCGRFLGALGQPPVPGMLGDVWGCGQGCAQGSLLLLIVVFQVGRRVILKGAAWAGVSGTSARSCQPALCPRCPLVLPSRTLPAPCFASNQSHPRLSSTVSPAALEV